MTLIRFLISWFKAHFMTSNLVVPPSPGTPESSQNVPPPAPDITYALADFLKYQCQFEAANPINNNPGNCKYNYGGYLPIYGIVKRSAKGFAMFETLELGMLYLTNLTKEIVKNHQELTILTYIGGDSDWSGYAPATDDNPVMNYANHIAKNLGTTISFLMRDLAGI